MSTVTRLDRREFVKLGALVGGGLILGVHVPGGATAEGPAALAFSPNVFLRVDPDGGVTIWVHRSDMGQGVRTALPMIVADELDADWSSVSVEQADAHASRYGRMMTVGSTSVRGGAWIPLRQAGAAAREMLVSAAARRWEVAPSECRTESGLVWHEPSGRSLGYGALADDAANFPVPSSPRLKDPTAFRLIGTRVPMLDTPAKVTGAARYGIDVRVPGMLYATILRPPVFGGSLRAFDPARALAVNGVTEVVELIDRVAVVAESTWAAFRGARELDVHWDEGPFTLGSAEIFRRFAELAETRGDAARGLVTAARRVDAEYSAPYLAHATMEPMNCTADVRADSCEIWAPTQNPKGRSPWRVGSRGFRWTPSPSTSPTWGAGGAGALAQTSSRMPSRPR